MLMKHYAYQAKMFIDGSSVLAITRLDPSDRRGCEAKLPCKRGMDDQHVPNVDKRGLTVSRVLPGVGGGAPSAPDGLSWATIRVAISVVRRGVVSLSHGSSLSLGGRPTTLIFVAANVAPRAGAVASAMIMAQYKQISIWDRLVS
jgi:hypothetical protein